MMFILSLHLISYCHQSLPSINFWMIIFKILWIEWDYLWWIWGKEGCCVFKEFKVLKDVLKKRQFKHYDFWPNCRFIKQYVKVNLSFKFIVCFEKERRCIFWRVVLWFVYFKKFISWKINNKIINETIVLIL